MLSLPLIARSIAMSSSMSVPRATASSHAEAKSGSASRRWYTLDRP
jgi:hypothetical protein